MEVPLCKVECKGNCYFVNRLRIYEKKCSITVLNKKDYNDHSNVFTFLCEDIDDILYDPYSEKRLVWVLNGKDIEAEGTVSKYKVGEYLSTKKTRKLKHYMKSLIFFNSETNLCPGTPELDNFWLYSAPQIKEWIEKEFKGTYMIRIRNSLENINGLQLLKLSTHANLKKIGLESTICRVKLLTTLKKKYFLNFYRLCFLNFQKCGPSPLQDYCVIDYLGSGAFGTVYKIKNRYNKKLYAIKDIACPDEETLIDQKKEISNLQRVDSPYVLKIYQWGASHENHIWLITDHCETSLDKYMKTEQIPILSLFTQILQGLIILHSNKIIHRDLKPANILIKISEDNITFIIADLGLSKHFDSTTEYIDGNIAGTPSYMAPEVLAREKYSYNVDIWSFVVILYHVITGELPNSALFREQIIQKIPPDFQNIMLYMCNGISKDRPSSLEVYKKFYKLQNT